MLGGVCLHAVSHARLRDTVLIPDAQTQTVRLQTTVCAMNTGDYLLRVQTACAEDEPPVYDDALFLSSGEQQLVVKTFPFSAPRFLPGSPYAGCAVRLTLFKRRLHRGTFFPGSRCDEQTVSCGYSGRPADYDLPLLSEECADPNALLARLSPMRLPGLRLDTPAPDLFYRKMTLSGIGVFSPRRHGRLARTALPSRMRILRRRPDAAHAQSAPLGRMAALRLDRLSADAARGYVSRRIALGSRGQTARSAESGCRRRFAVASRRPRSAQRGGGTAGTFFGFALCARRLAG